MNLSIPNNYMSLISPIENLTKSTNAQECDSRRDKFELLSYAIELTHRRIITSECHSVQQIERERMWMFEDAIETLLSFKENITSAKSSMMTRALRRAYDVFSAHTAEREMAFCDVSYAEYDWLQDRAPHQH